MRVIAKWAADDIRDRPLNARVEVIPEPLKARIITKGESLPYYASMPLQKDAWRTLVEKEEFSLIGEPLSEQHFIAIDQGTRQLLDAVGLPDITFTLWVSGDYSAATDGLFSCHLPNRQGTVPYKSRGIAHGDDLIEYWPCLTSLTGGSLTNALDW